ncbi:fasciclin domain-containing protein [Longibacter sp.]|jgi:transforming growth factor-beta-induced protein|uniref:fasciclin domain-containing protein n=1 Tax=Longibacter sp. TaxID=2045415 RepID=UPI003EB9520F
MQLFRQRSIEHPLARLFPTIVTVLFLAAALVLAGCDNDDDDGGMGTMPDPTITELAGNASNLSTLAGALGQAGLDDDLNGDGPFTVFAPSNTAFQQIDVNDLTSDSDLLEEVLTYHVVQGEITASDISDGQTVETLEGETLRFSLSNGGVQVNGANVTTADLQASNGVVHVIDGVLLETVTTTDRAVLTPGLSTLADAVGAAGLADDLSGDGPFTVFAPVNAAFDEIDASELTADSDLLNKILTYHVVGGSAIEAGDISDGQTVETLQGGDLTFSVDGGTVRVNGIEVTTANIQTSNGVVHLIDSVLLEAATTTERAVLTPQLSTLTDAVIAAGLDDDLNGDGPFTVFAPVDAAFGNIDAGELTADSDLLSKVLTYHVVAGSAIEAGDISDGQTAESLQGGDLSFSVDGGTVRVNGIPVTTADIQTSNGVVHLIDGVLLEATTVTERAILTPTFSTLADLVVQAGLDDDLNGSGPFTVLAPTNQAFLDALDANDNGQIDGNEVPSQSQLESILTYHVIAGQAVESSAISDGQSVETLEGSDVTFGVSGGTITVNPSAENATVAAPDVQVSNGIIHGIDTVLTPPSGSN